MRNIFKSNQFFLCSIEIESFGKEQQISGVKGDHRQVHLQQLEYFEFDPRLIWRPVNNRSLFNAQSFRGDIVAINKKERLGNYYIFVFGDSNTLGPSDGKSLSWVEYTHLLLKNDTYDKCSCLGGVFIVAVFKEAGGFA